MSKRFKKLKNGKLVRLPKKPRLYKGISKFAVHKRWGNRGFAEMYWALSIEVGDLIHTCFSWPWNCRVAKPSDTEIFIQEPLRRKRWNENKKSHFVKGGSWILTNVIFYDEKGREHHLNGIGCVGRANTPEEIREILASVYKNEEEIREMVPGYFFVPNKDATEEEIKNYQEMVEQATEKAIKLWNAAREGRPVCDENGFKIEIE